jgi:hypothetical protein
MVAFHQLMDSSKNSLTLDRLSYKLRMKSDLNIDTLRETDIRRRRHHRPQLYPLQQNQMNLEVSDISSSALPSTLTKTYTPQNASMTLSTDVMKTLINDDLNGVEGNAVRVGTLDDIMKRFRRAEFHIIPRPTDYLDSPSTCVSSNLSRNERPIKTKSHHQQQERPLKQPQALTEYRFKTPTLPTLSTRIYRESTNPQALLYQYKTKERNNKNTDLALLHQCPLNSPEPHRPRLNSLTIHEQQPIEMSFHDKRIQESREKILMRTEKQLCVCNKLTIGDPFNSNADHAETTISQLHQSQQQQPSPPSVNYIFPPVRPFGYFTRKPTTDDTHQSTGSITLSPRLKKKPVIKKKPNKLSNNGLDLLDKIATIERNDDLQMSNERIKSTDSLSDFYGGIHNTTLDVDFNLAGTLIQDTDEEDEL